MMHVSVLVPRGAAVVNCIEGCFVLLNVVNGHLAAMGKPRAFDVHLVALGKEAETYDRFFSVSPDLSIDEVESTDLIIIPAINGDKSEVIAANRAFLPWIVRQHRGGAEVASLCVGAFLLAATGLLNGHKCTTHWSSVNDFRRRFTEVSLVSASIITDEAGLYSSGGALSFWNLLLYLIEKYTDRDTAIFAAKYFEIDINRNDQAHFLIFNGQKDHQDDSIKRAQVYIESNYQQRITVEQLCAMFALGRRSLERRFKQATGNTVSEYIQRVKIEAAKKDFEASRKNVHEVMYDVGYSDTKAFRTVFRRITGMSPIDYRNKYRAGLR
jgi:transcriptional regulator GlxA family with amidase domain